MFSAGSVLICRHFETEYEAWITDFDECKFQKNIWPVSFFLSAIIDIEGVKTI